MRRSVFAFEATFNVVMPVFEAPFLVVVEAVVLRCFHGGDAANPKRGTAAVFPLVRFADIKVDLKIRACWLWLALTAVGISSEGHMRLSPHGVVGWGAAVHRERVGVCSTGFALAAVGLAPWVAEVDSVLRVRGARCELLRIRAGLPTVRRERVAAVPRCSLRVVLRLQAGRQAAAGVDARPVALGALPNTI